MRRRRGRLVIRRKEWFWVNSPTTHHAVPPPADLERLQRENARQLDDRDPWDLPCGWTDKVPGFEFLKDTGLPRNLLYRLFGNSAKALTYWTRSHARLNKLARHNHQYATLLAACALGQGFDQGETRASKLRQTRSLLYAWWKFHDIVPDQPAMELITILDGALKKTKKVRAQFNPDAQRKIASTQQKQRRRQRAAEAGRGYRSFTFGENSM